MATNATPSDHRGEDGWCGFCNGGGGHLGDTGDERSRYLNSTVRNGNPGNCDYSPHPHSLPAPVLNIILWCGVCNDGLAHKYARYDNQNLLALHTSHQYRLFVDPLRWDAWDTSAGTPEHARAVEHQDDTAVHIEKLGIHDSIVTTQKELERRGVTIPSLQWGTRPTI